MASLLSTQELSKQYGKQKAVHQVSLTLNKGEICGIVGENGAGKTTLLRMLSGVISQTSGTITSSKDCRIGALIESPALQPNLSAIDNLRYMALQLNLKQADEKILETLAIVGLEDVDPKKKSKDFSLGMRQRLAIALAILDDPDFLILDEPINGLDPVGIKEMRSIILNLRNQYGMTILISSHILSELEMVVDRYIIMHKGLIVKEFSKQELEQTLEEQLYLQTKNHPKTFTILEEQGIAYKIDKDYISLSSDTNVMSLIHLLINHEIEVKEIFKQQMSFEDYYLTLLQEGEEHDTLL
ncbi:TPA: ATP-binding cassette domain-containing protein [Streptococcus suis]|uniref:ATP-binding cassette domain-containing protein n=1 Tax=Streptococcus parasuis TaxID=1501662 RepID=UPI00040EF686|nr:ATP-binding cassette domain-containing protein [Streptococcus parasuis]NQM55726.1 ATP-binding cassette domain-containing protein [Streptococcus suis]QWV86133.1 ATP-binding cassette domain-containing protein [Streptococcus parasuis]HEL1557004.1 ATP-binding cassette domain-containing protein [Streptococcus suis]HEM3176748.1 ATP-binding cassette domain-containing protein [Streptococcus suis]HEM3650097.1 ATP-binding cassette domain-containing protein [Streptococcus suis]